MKGSKSIQKNNQIRIISSVRDDKIQYFLFSSFGCNKALSFFTLPCFCHVHAFFFTWFSVTWCSFFHNYSPDYVSFFNVHVCLDVISLHRNLCSLYMISHAWFYCATPDFRYSTSLTIFRQTREFVNLLFPSLLI